LNVIIFKSILFLWWQSWIFSIITPVFSVTWSFRDHSNVQEHHYLMVVPRNLMVSCWHFCCHY